MLQDLHEDAEPPEDPATHASPQPGHDDTSFAARESSLHYDWIECLLRLCRSFLNSEA